MAVWTALFDGAAVCGCAGRAPGRGLRLPWVVSGELDEVDLAEVEGGGGQVEVAGGVVQAAA